MSERSQVMIENAENVSSRNYTLMVLAGGTGGHIYPALAVAELLAEKGVKVVWVGTQRGLESKLSFPEYVTMEWINMTGVTNKGLLSWLTMPFKLFSSVRQVSKIIKKHKPDLAFGTGGYVAAPGGIAAYMNDVPLVIHESNAVAGITNKYLAKIAEKVMVAIADTKEIGDKQIFVGSPVRKAIVKALDRSNDEDLTARLAARKPIRISVVGGSQGAQIFNEVLPEALAKISSQPLKIVHQTGKGKFEGVAEEYKKFNDKNLHEIDVREYIDDMAELYHQTDLIICRAGAMTVAEIALASLPAIIIPIPNSAGDHQLANATYYQKQRAGIMIEQDQFDVHSVQLVVEKLIADPERLKKMAESARRCARPEAAREAAAICWEEMHA